MICALSSAVCIGTASVLQATAARSVQPGTGSGVDLVLLMRALRQWRYVAGLTLDFFGFVLQLVALLTVPIYAVEAAQAGSLAVTAVIAARVLKVPLNRIEWSAVAVVCAGLAALGFSSGAEGDIHTPPALPYALLGVACAVLVAGALAGRLRDPARSLLLGFGAGTGFGVVSVSVRLINEDPAPSAVFANPALYALLLGGGTAFLLFTSALQRGSVTTATAGMVIGETIGPALVGVVWLGDRTREGLAWLAISGFAVAVAGALALARFGEAPVAAVPGAERAATPSADDGRK
ncbi:DMT family transporter [Streptomyces sp. ISL-98]|uniref:DMT family transporter n=1 Tax=Streptomyces sp. ISL-98 TaxID=2819192 RepID=UPI001BE642BD|nr:DMT family transporter [Streptomyces sp. ISL-98]MBT2507190.1 DMT family transporter [Streptomyces sp. ISL-98]